MMGRLYKRWIKGKTLDTKLQILFAAMLTCQMIFMLGVTTASAVHTLYDTSSEQAKAQLSYIADGYENRLEHIASVIEALEIDENVQTFCRDEGKDAAGSGLKSGFNRGLKRSLGNQLNTNRDMNFLAVVSERAGYVFSGNQSITATNFETAYENSFKKSIGARIGGSIRVQYGSEYFSGKRSTVTFYCPVYSSVTLRKEIGMIVINLDDWMSGQGRDYPDDRYMAVYMEEGSAVVPVSGVADTGVAGKRQMKEAQISFHESGRWRDGANVYLYKKVGRWNMYIVSMIPVHRLFASSLPVAMLTAALTCAGTALSLYMMRRMIKRSYRPLRRVLDAMDAAAAKKLDFRLRTDDMGADFVKLGEGFNSMAEALSELMAEVRREQQQVDQIRLDALQSQIQPHFLYNTLECIRWQLRAEGNRDAANLVLSLAQYYRLCLNKGKEMVTLKKELEHIHHYVIIQNMRYGNIVRYSCDVRHEFMDVPIPKLTLQPLVENSIYHGIRVREGGSGHVCVRAYEKGGRVCVEVSDSGQGMTERELASVNASILVYDEEFGYGVRNVNRRLQLTFGSGYGLHYRSNREGGVTVEIWLPCQ